MQNTIDTRAGLTHFQHTDQRMYEILSLALEAENPIAIPIAKAPSHYFASIVRSIISQQISTKVAQVLQSRVEALAGELSPESIQVIPFDELKACGLSMQKTTYIKRNAETWHEIPYQDFASLPDESVISELTKLYGVGRWTAEMFLIFSLARPDVFSRGDLGLMQSLYRTYNYKPHYVRKVHTTIADWSPHRTLAALALWHSLDNGPVLL